MINFTKKTRLSHFYKSLLWFVVINSVLFAQANELQAKETNKIFYKISTDSSEVFLLGSIHFGKAEWYPMAKLIENAFKKSDYLVTEIDINNVDPMLLMNYMTLKDGTTLKSKLKLENYTKILQAFESLGMNEAMVQNFRPWFAAVTYQTLKATEESELDQTNGVDLYFTKKANESKKKIKEIETAESQINLLVEFDNFADEVIESVDKESKDSTNEIDELVSAWENGDEEKIDSILNQQDKEFPQMSGLMEKILNKRNLNMTASIENYLKEKKTYFVIVGAGHLVGEKGIVNLLKKKKSYKIERL